LLAYSAIHGLALSASIMLELTVLTRKFWKEGFAVGNIYSRLTTYILILIPGFVVAMLPIITFFFAGGLGLPAFAAMAASEFSVMIAIVASQK